METTMSDKDICQWWHDPLGDVRVMTVVEGYVVARRPRCAPFIKSLADFKNTFQEGKRP